MTRFSLYPCWKGGQPTADISTCLLFYRESWTCFNCLTCSIRQRAIGVAAVAENTAKEAECGRVAAVEERETAVNEVNAIRDTMEVTSVKLQNNLSCNYFAARAVSGIDLLLATHMVFF